MSLGHGSSIIRNGLVLHLDAANRKSYPGTGTTWFDLSGLGNNGTMSSVAYDSSGSMLFDAASDNVLVSHTSAFNFSSVFSVSVWLRVNSFNTSSIYNIISKKPSFNNTQKGWSCQYDYRATGVLQYRNNDATVLNDSTPTSTVNNTSLLNQTTTWVNTVWTINGTVVSYYINGVAKGTNTAAYTNTDTSTNIYIGKTVGSVSGDDSLPMNLSSVLIHNRALSAQEVQQNFNAYRGRYGI